jgi:hypothetical protein
MVATCGSTIAGRPPDAESMQRSAKELVALQPDLIVTVQRTTGPPPDLTIATVGSQLAMGSHALLERAWIDLI